MSVRALVSVNVHKRALVLTQAFPAVQATEETKVNNVLLYSGVSLQKCISILQSVKWCLPVLYLQRLIPCLNSLTQRSLAMTTIFLNFVRLFLSHKISIKNKCCPMKNNSKELQLNN